MSTVSDVIFGRAVSTVCSCVLPCVPMGKPSINLCTFIWAYTPEALAKWPFREMYYFAQLGQPTFGFVTILLDVLDSATKLVLSLNISGCLLLIYLHFMFRSGLVCLKCIWCARAWYGDLTVNRVVEWFCHCVISNYINKLLPYVACSRERANTEQKLSAKNCPYRPNFCVDWLKIDTDL